MGTINKIRAKKDQIEADDELEEGKDDGLEAEEEKGR